MNADIIKRIRYRICESLDIRESDLVDDAILYDAYGADSLDGIEISFALENEFDIVIPAGEDRLDCLCVNEIAELVERIICEQK